MGPESPAEPGIVEFGRFRIFPQRRELLADGRPIELGGRAFDLLMALVAAPGAVLSNAELMQRVWPGRVVDENSLQVQISALRKALEPDRDLVRTVAGRGYQFAGELRAAVSALPRSPTNLPERVSELIGRDAELRDVTELARAHRLVTLIGAGGIGKTRLAQEAARQLLPRFADGVRVAELAPLSDPELVPVAVATALGITFAGGAVSPERVAAALGARELLLVLDNCEHVIEAAARMGEALLRASSLTCVLATSREPLRAEGEYVYRVPSLEVPPAEARALDELLQAGAVRLFVARVRAAEPHVTPDRRLAAIAGAICRRLDGIPLAIELAAARAAALGLEGLASRLDDRFRVLTGGQRTALPRHQTLRATLDWSYELLPAAERVVLARLATFAGAFTLVSASAVVASREISAPDVVDCVANLVTKSLVTADARDATVRYRLLETTRAYALEKLAGGGEREEFARRHAAYYRDLFEQAESESRTRPVAEWLDAYGSQIDDVRAALDWAFSPGGEARVGVALAVAAVPLWMHLSLVDECRARVAQALAGLATAAGSDVHREMRLQAALGAALLYTGVGPEVTAAWTHALSLAERLHDTDYQLRALWGLWADRLNNGKFREALALAEQFSRVAAHSADPVDPLVGDRLIGFALHCLGDQAGARRHTERMLSGYVAPVHGAHIVRFQFDQLVVGRMALALILWLQGSPDQAMRTVERTVDHAFAINHVLSRCIVLAQAACPVALFTGDLGTAERFVAMLLDTSAGHGLDSWHGLGRCFQGVLLIKRGEVVTGLRVLRTALDELPEFRPSVRYTAVLGEMAAGLARAGEIGKSLAAIDGALERSLRNEERWSVAEQLRIKGELVVLEGSPSAAAAAEDYFLRSLDWARRQGALAWELRSATSLARLWGAQGRTREARELLAPVYGRFTEGFGTADLQAAKALLDA